MNTPKHIVIVGAGHAGGRVAQHLRALGYDQRLTLVGEEPHAPYERPALSKELLKGERSAAELVLGPSDFWMDGSAVEHVRGRASALDAGAKLLTLDDGSAIGFDRLVVATGGRARTLNIPGADLAGVVTLRTIDDSLALRETLMPGRRVAIVGAGVIGMEVAASARALGADVTVLEAGQRILARCLPAAASEWLHGLHTANGTCIETGVQVSCIERDGTALRVHVARDGETWALAADIVLAAVGIDSGVDFLQGTGIANEHGVPVGADCRSPVAPWCFAAGDVALTYSPLYQRAVRQETWRNAENQAQAVAGFILGRTEPYVEVPWMWTDQLGHNIQVVGHPGDADEIIVRDGVSGDPATMLLLRGEQVVGGVLINNGRDRKHLEALVRNGTRVERSRLADTAVPLKALAS
ncbi:FAD-dependent oxidoreductase [Cupriavidus necator]|uniref:NAD(P)/FAD-dependent oxidoreductase n=1 Tax=Cupriavidus necator TaxID=106590 RepID=UPI0039C34AAE